MAKAAILERVEALEAWRTMLQASGPEPAGAVLPEGNTLHGLGERVYQLEHWAATVDERIRDLQARQQSQYELRQALEYLGSRHDRLRKRVKALQSLLQAPEKAGAGNG